MREGFFVGIDPERENIGAAIAAFGEGIFRDGEMRARTVPGHFPFAHAAFDRGDDLVGDGLMNIEPRLRWPVLSALGRVCASARR